MFNPPILIVLNMLDGKGEGFFRRSVLNLPLLFYINNLIYFNINLLLVGIFPFTLT